MSTYVTNYSELESALSQGGSIYFDPTLVLTITDPLTISNPTVLNGGRFRVPEGSKGAFIIASSGVTINGGRYAGDGISNVPDRDQLFIYAEGSASNTYNDIIIRDTEMVGSLGSNIWLKYCTSVKVQNNHIHDYLYGGVMLLSNNGFHVSHNDIHDAPMIAPIVNTYGIAMTDEDNTISGRSRNGTVVGNIVKNMPWEGIDTHGGDSISITGNNLFNCARGIALVIGNSSRLIPPTNITVTGNFIDMDGGKGNAVALMGRSGIAVDAVITSNNVVNYTNKNPIYAQYYDTSKTFIGNNNVPWINWRNITMDGGWNGHSTYVPQYMVDGRTVSLRGMVQPPNGIKQSHVGIIASAYTPDALSFTGTSKGSNPAAGLVAFAMNTNGVLTSYYGSGNDSYYYPLDGSYQLGQ